MRNLWSISTWRLEKVPHRRRGSGCAFRRGPADLRFAHHIVDFAEQILFSVRLADEAAMIGNFRLSGRYLTGSDDQEDAGPTSVNLSREVHTVARAGHLNVGEKQPHIVAGFQQFQRGVRVRGFDDAKTIFLEQTGVYSRRYLWRSVDGDSIRNWASRSYFARRLLTAVLLLRGARLFRSPIARVAEAGETRAHHRPGRDSRPWRAVSRVPPHIG
jgi:hypothetical protein